MFKYLTALTLSATLALTSIASPAAADSRDLAKVLGGLTLLYVITEAAKADKRKAKAHQHQQTQKKKRHRKVIPSKCYRELASNGRVIRGYGAKCMQNNVKRAGALPPSCLRKVETYRGKRYVYRPKCLRNQGWVRS